MDWPTVDDDSPALDVDCCAVDESDELRSSNVGAGDDPEPPTDQPVKGGADASL